DIEMYHKTVEHTEVTTFVEEEYFTVKKWEVSGETKMSLESPFLLGSVIAGKGTLTMEDVTYSLEKGQHFILPNDTEDFLLDGAFTLIVSHPCKMPIEKTAWNTLAVFYVILVIGYVHTGGQVHYWTVSSKCYA